MLWKIGMEWARLSMPSSFLIDDVEGAIHWNPFMLFQLKIDYWLIWFVLLPIFVDDVNFRDESKVL